MLAQRLGLKCLTGLLAGDDSLRVRLSNNSRILKPRRALSAVNSMADARPSKVRRLNTEVICLDDSPEKENSRPAAPANALLASLHAERKARTAAVGKMVPVYDERKKVPAMVPEYDSVKTGGASSTLRAPSSSGASSKAKPEAASTSGKHDITILTYNVWFREDVCLTERLRGLSSVVSETAPDVIFFQELTPRIYILLSENSWWKSYRSSTSPAAALSQTYFAMILSRLPVGGFAFEPFSNSIMGRELCKVTATFGQCSLLLATSHLESPCPAPPKWDQMYTKERVAQAKKAVQTLNGQSVRNIIFGGDMNWCNDKDGPPPLLPGWVDVWPQLHPSLPGYTYDTKSNPMLKGGRGLYKRLDRFFVKLEDFEVTSIDMVGTRPIPGATYQKETKGKKPQVLQLPVLPSDHFGLLMKLKRVT